MFSGGLEDEQGKYNLYNLARAGVPQPAEEQVLLRLLGLLRLPDTLAPRIIDIVAMGQPPAQPAEAPPSAAQPPARAPLPRGVQELGAALGLDPAVRDELQRTMTLLPANTLVNVNTAPPEVIAALAPGLSIGQARAIAGERDRGNAFNNSGDFANRLAGAGFKGTPPAVVTASGWFMARGVVVYERARLTAQALLRATPGAAPATVWMRETIEEHLTHRPSPWRRWTRTRRCPMPGSTGAAVARGRASWRCARSARPMRSRPARRCCTPRT